MMVLNGPWNHITLNIIKHTTTTILTNVRWVHMTTAPTRAGGVCQTMSLKLKLVDVVQQYLMGKCKLSLNIVQRNKQDGTPKISSAIDNQYCVCFYALANNNKQKQNIVGISFKPDSQNHVYCLVVKKWLKI